MNEQFRKYKPKVAVVEIWGINAFDTYIDANSILEGYFQLNIEMLPLSLEKIEVINDFDTLNILYENFPITKYKGRIMRNQLIKEDFNYSYDSIVLNHLQSEIWLADEMTNRFENNGYLLYDYKSLEQYLNLQSYVDEDEMLEIEPQLIKYIDKIIDLCEENDVELIFYRASYLSKETELSKANYLREYLNDRNIPYYDLEKEIQFDYTKDFFDLQHLSENGANKATEFLNDVIIECLP